MPSKTKPSTTVRRPRNPVAQSPLLRKGGPHQRCKSGERQLAQKDLRQAVERAVRPRSWED